MDPAELGKKVRTLEMPPKLDNMMILDGEKKF